MLYFQIVAERHLWEMLRAGRSHAYLTAPSWQMYRALNTLRSIFQHHAAMLIHSRVCVH
jgi:hypothetical protein